MKKQAMIASLMALALLVSPIGSLGSMHQVSAEEDPGAVVYSASGNASGAGDTTQKVQLDTPTNLRWGDEEIIPQSQANGKYCGCWDGVNESINDYGWVRWEIQVYKDDQYFWGVGTADEGHGNQHYLNISDYINESGDYKFRVKAVAVYDDESYQDSEWSEWSESISYVRPEKEMGITKGYWDTTAFTGNGHFIPLEDSQYVDHYMLWLYKQNNDGNWYSFTGVTRGASEEIINIYFGWDMEQSGEGKYCFTVRAYSNDIDVVANGKEGPMSDILDTTVNAEKLNGILSGAEGMGAADTVTALKDSAELSAIQQAMQTSDDFREQVKDLESRYATEQNITVEAPAVSDTAKEYVDPGKVSLVGAAFNALQGQEVGLQMDVTPAENRVPTYSGYKKNVQLDIRLVSGNTEIHDLAMPISVTMPVPQGINASQLVILHYHADGTTEKAAFHVNDDGTITFTVTSFSTFVFAEVSSADTPDDNPDPTPGQNRPPYNPIWDPIQDAGGSSDWSASLGNLESQIASAAPGATVKVTRDQNINTLPNSIMQILAKRGDVTLEMEYTYEGTDYHVIIPAGKAMDNDIPWYGPLYLSAYFSAGDAVTESISTYIVQKGDTLGKIARNNNTTIARLAAANPQIKNVNRIVPGQVINIK